MSQDTETKTKDKYDEWADNALQNIFDTLEQIQPGQITVLCGDNGTGKSLIRKVLCTTLRKKTGDSTLKVADISMDRRTGLHSELGGGGVFVRDTEWVATSENSLSFLKGILESSKNRFLVLDEPEVGMSQDLQKSIGIYLSKRLPEVMDKNLGVLIITHSKELLRNLSVEHTFLNLQKKSEEEWLNEEAKEVDLDEFEKQCLALFKLLQTHLK